jgi:hypothetical protein
VLRAAGLGLTAAVAPPPVGPGPAAPLPVGLAVVAGSTPSPPAWPAVESGPPAPLPVSLGVGSPARPPAWPRVGVGPPASARPARPGVRAAAGRRRPWVGREVARKGEGAVAGVRSGPRRRERAHQAGAWSCRPAQDRDRAGLWAERPAWHHRGLRRRRHPAAPAWPWPASFEGAVVWARAAQVALHVPASGGPSLGPDR